MMSEFVKRNCALYKKLKECHCPALNETIHFNADGLHHLLYKKRRPRNHKERHARTALIPHIVTVIQRATRAIKELRNGNVATWALQHRIRKGMIVKVILIQRGEGKIFFLSVMKKNSEGGR